MSHPESTAEPVVTPQHAAANDLSVDSSAAAKPTPSLRSVLLRQAAQYSVGTGLSMMSGIARAGVAARFLTHEQVGAWLGLQVLLGYAANLHFGSIFGMFRSVPIKLARGDRAGAEEEERTSLSFVSVVALVGVAVGAFVAPRFLPDVRLRHVMIGLALAALALVKGWSVSSFKAGRRFGELSISSAIGACFSFVTIALIPRLGIDALLGGMALQGLVEVLVLGWFKGRPTFGISRPVLIEQLRVGFVTLLTNLGITALTTIERTMMLRFLGIAATGTFVIGAQIVFLVPVLAAIPGAVLTPILFERVGRGDDLMPAVQKPVMMLAYGFSWIIGAGLVALDPVVALLWPHLADGNPAAKFALVGTFPMILAGPMSNVFYALDRQGPFVLILAVATAMTAAATWLGIRVDASIAGASAGASAGLYIYYLTVAGGAFSVIRTSWSTTGTFIVRSLAPMFYVLAVVAACELVLPRFWTSTSIVRALVAEVIVGVAMLPWIARALALFRGRS